MFGKRRHENRHVLGEMPGDTESDSVDPDIAEALIELGRNRGASRPAQEPESAASPGEAGISDVDESNAPVAAETAAPTEKDERWEAPSADAPSVPTWAAVPTAAMLAEPEPEPEPEREQPSGGQLAMQALSRERAKSAQQEAELRQAQDDAAALRAQVAELQADLVQRTELQAQSNDGADDELRSAAERADAAEQSALDLQAKVSELTVELERARADAAGASVALERLEREAKDRDRALAVAEERAERLAAEVQQLRTSAAKEPVNVERLQREADREQALRSALEQARAAAEQSDTALAENRRLTSDLAANLQSQEAVVAALIGLQAEVTEQRAWFEAQLASMRDMEAQQTGVVDALEAAVRDRDTDLEVLRQQLLDVEAKRADEAAAFVAALERP